MTATALHIDTVQARHLAEALAAGVFDPACRADTAAHLETVRVFLDTYQAGLRRVADTRGLAVTNVVNTDLLLGATAAGELAEIVGAGDLWTSTPPPAATSHRWIGYGEPAWAGKVAA